MIDETKCYSCLRDNVGKYDVTKLTWIAVDKPDGTGDAEFNSVRICGRCSFTVMFNLREMRDAALDRQ